MPTFPKFYNTVVPSSVSRSLDAGEASWDTLLAQSGRPILDADLNLTQDVGGYNRVLLASRSLPSGFFRGQGIGSSFSDYSFYGAPAPADANKFELGKLLAIVAGMPVAVEYTGTTTPGANVITLPAAQASSGISPDIKTTDFVFLEVWRAQVAPSPRARGTIEIVDPQVIAPGDTTTIDATAVAGPAVTFVADGGGATGFAIGASANATATNLVAAINNPANGLYPTYVAARSLLSNTVIVTATFGGVAGNGILLAESTGGINIVVSAATLLNGADRTNKPNQNAIYRHGNVGSPSGVNLTDDLVDPVLNVETTQRVQIQYRLRVYSDLALGVNPKSQPDAFSNVNILAQGAQGAPVATYPFVPADAATVVANSDATAYGFEDAGLYLAGDGSSAASTALGSVDGFVYAIPVCFVFRRNDATATGGFSPAANANGGINFTHVGFANTHIDVAGPVAIAAGKSDRPDGLFHDLIDAVDVLDLRRHVTPPGYDFASELKFQSQSLMDQTNLTWQVDASDVGLIGNGSGGQSTTPMYCNEVGRAGAPGFAGDFIREFDHVARRFASQSVVEQIVFEVLPTGAHPTGITVTKAGASVLSWCEGDVIDIDFSLLEASSLQDWTIPVGGAPKVSAAWPVGTRVTDVLTVFHDDGHDTVMVDQATQLALVTGVGTDIISLTLDSNPSVINDGGIGVDHPMVDDPALDGGSTRRLFIELEVTYPTGAGLLHTPDTTLTPSASSGYLPYDGGSVVEQDSTQRPPEMDVTWVPNPKFRSDKREVLLEQKSTIFLDSIVTRNTTKVYTPRRIQTATGLLANGAPPVTPAIGSASRELTLAAAVAGQVLIAVTYVPQDPIPNAGAGLGYQLDVYYTAVAPQTCGIQLGGPVVLPTEITLEPVAVLDNVWTGQVGKGSTDDSFPYGSPMEQVPTVDIGAGFPKEWYFSATADVAITDFNAQTGLLTLHSLVQMDGSNTITLGNTAPLGRGPLTDGEFRAYYDYANYLGYKPTAMAQPLSGAVRHKVFTTMLVRSTTSNLLFRKGELLLVVISRFADLDANNNIAFTDLPAIRTAASIYRTKNLLLTTGN